MRSEDGLDSYLSKMKKCGKTESELADGPAIFTFATSSKTSDASEIALCKKRIIVDDQ